VTLPALRADVKTAGVDKPHELRARSYTMPLLVGGKLVVER
jgi:hypothetical protein